MSDREEAAVVEARVINNGDVEDISIPETRRAAVAVLSLLWRSIPLGTFDQREIWGIFERRVQACAIQTVTLQDFFESLKRKLKVQDLQGTRWEREEVARILEQDDADEVLREIREYPALCVLHVRVQQEAKKAAWEERN